MKTFSPDPRGTHRITRPLLAATALSAMLALSGCGSSEEAPSQESTPTSAGASVSASDSPAAASTTPSASPTGPSSSVPESSETARASEAARTEPEETRKATAPEVGMPSASPFDKEEADRRAADSVCDASRLRGTAAPSQGAAGHTVATLTLTHTGSAPCTLDGYPGVSFVDAGGAMVGAPASRQGGGTAPVTLRPGASASTTVSITRPGVIGQVCNPQDITGLRVYPPGSHESLVVSYAGQACGNPKVSQLQVKGFGA